MALALPPITSRQQGQPRALLHRPTQCVVQRTNTLRGCPLVKTNNPRRQPACPPRPQCVSTPLAPTQPSAPSGSNSTGSHAIVIGGSITGMITAQALTRVFDKVTVLERDAILPTSLEKTTKRGGVPQFQQPHIMLLKGLAVLESLWPGIQQEFLDAGAQRINYGRDLKTMYNGVFTIRYKWEDNEGITASRALIEAVIRSQLLQNPKVTVRPASLVSGLTMDDDAVTGVQLRDGATMTADLVVDAAGRASQASTWLKELGYEAPEEVSINANVVYNSVNVKPKHDLPYQLYNCFNVPFFHVVAIPIENGVYQVIFATIGGMGNASYEDFIKYAATFPSPYIKEFLEQCEPVTPPTSYSATGNRFRKFENLERLPENMVFVGDSVAAFNPVYGQGMACGAIAAEALLEMLEKQMPVQGAGRLSSSDVRVAIKGLPKVFQAELAKRLSFAWSIATAKDLIVLGDKATVSQKPSAAEQLVGRYMEALFAASLVDKQVHKKVAMSMHLVAPPTTLFGPDMLLRTLAVSVRRRFFPQSINNTGEMET